MGVFDIFKSKCAADGTIIKSCFNIDPIIPTGLNQEKKSGRSQTFCKEHFLIELGNKLKEMFFPLLFCEPLGKNDKVISNSQNYYYTPASLTYHGYGPEDKDDLERLLKNAAKEKPVVWLPKEFIGDTNKTPLFKIKEGAFELITYDELINRLNNIFFIDPSRKISYTVNLPYDGPGIYVYYDYI